MAHTGKSEPLAEMSRSIELDHIESGVRAYRRIIQSVDRSRLSPDKNALAYQIYQLESRIAELQDELVAGKRMKGIRKWGPYILSVAPDCLAAITVCTVFNSITNQHGAGSPDLLVRQTHALSSAIANGVKAQLELDRFRREHPALFHKWQAHGGKEWTPRVHDVFRRKKQMDLLNWDVASRMHVGQQLLFEMLNTCDMIQLERRWNRTPKGGWVKGIYVRLDPLLLERIEQSHENREILFTPMPWMLIPPVTWASIKPDSLDCGGYLLIKNNFIRRRGGDMGYSPELADHDLSATFRAVNWIQATPYQLNRPVYHVIKELAEAGTGRAGLAESNPLPLCPRPDYDAMSEGDIKQAKAAYREWLTAENERVGKRCANLSTLNAARKYEKYDRIFTPWNCDFRSRIYPCVSSLSPQGSDMDSGMVTFADPVPQTKEGRYWLAVHTANCAGQDKLPFDDRVRWVKENERDIARSAEDPYSHRWWEEQDDAPVALLSACREWMRTDGLTQLPIPQDGNCSGIQHIGALMRDPLAARAVSLMPGDRPEDIYARVAEAVTRILDKDVLDGRIWFDGDEKKAEYRKTVARYWHEMGITRSTVKRAVMTIGYGLTDEGMARQFVADKWCSYLNQAHYLTDRVNESLDETLGKVRGFMAWMQECGGKLADHGVPCQWLSPNNFLTIQKYLKVRPRTIFTALQKLTFTVPDHEAGLDRASQKRGIAPNYIHSFDASHVMLTANQLRKDGVPAFKPVHDSFAVHAPYVPLMRQRIRETFVEMYSRCDWIGEQHRQWQELIDEELPPPPERGELDITCVLDSDYCFS